MKLIIIIIKKDLPRIIAELKNKGYFFVKVGDLIYKDNYYIDNIDLKLLCDLHIRKT